MKLFSAYLRTNLVTFPCPDQLLEQVHEIIRPTMLKVLKAQFLLALVKQLKWNHNSYPIYEFSNSYIKFTANWKDAIEI